jgi:hypothetical protein
MDLTKKINWYFGLVMVLVILFLGIGLLLTDVAYDTISGSRRTWMGVIFLVYAGFRAIRVYMQYKQFKSETND